MTTPIIAEAPSKGKISGPVNGNECYFWRTTGCVYGDNCLFKPIKENKQIDKKKKKLGTKINNIFSIF